MAAKPEATAAAGEEPCPIAWVWSPAAAAEHARRRNSAKHRTEVARYKKGRKEFERLGKRWTIYVVLAAASVLARSASAKGAPAPPGSAWSWRPGGCLAWPSSPLVFDGYPASCGTTCSAPVITRRGNKKRLRKPIG
ncbi:hypothetical protein ZWY2020_027821 [Hordeum vulgare]|nr:hypothetical protein ZWY2020_027821 [Hordeum vulgare]